MNRCPACQHFVITLAPVAPVGVSTGAAFVARASADGIEGIACGVEVVTTPKYPPRSAEADRFDAYRESLGLSLREAANRMGISAVDISDVLRGKVTPDDWPHFTDLLKHGAVPNISVRRAP